MFDIDSSFYILYGIIQNAGIIKNNENCLIKFTHENVFKWCQYYFNRNNINYTILSGLSLLFNYSNLSVVKKHLLFWIYSTDIKVHSIFHPILFQLTKDEFNHLLLGWIYSRLDYSLTDRETNKRYFFLFFNELNNYEDLITLLKLYDIHFYILTDENDIQNIQHIYVKVNTNQLILLKN